MNEAAPDAMQIKIAKIEMPSNCNIIIGQSHFIKTIDDLYERIAESVPNAKFGICFCEASQKCLVRISGNDTELKKAAEKAGMLLSAGHVFVIFLKNAFPINILNSIKNMPEVCRIFCATGNPLQVIIAETKQGRGILGVIDGFKSKGVETEADVAERKQFLKQIGYKT